MDTQLVIKLSGLLVTVILTYTSTTINFSDDNTFPHVDDNLTLGDSIIAFAKTLEGLPYRQGGCSSDRGFDCSGLVNYSYNAFKIKVGRSSREQALAGFAVKPDDARPGDIIVFARTPKGRVFHAGLVLTNALDSLVILHANERNGVHRTNVTISQYWNAKVNSIRRIERGVRP